ncbi:MAG: hypothetical protein ACXWP5_08335 [Bdellovibrionota bacterium]
MRLSLVTGLVLLFMSSVALADNGALSCGTNKGGVRTRATFAIDELGTPIKQWDWDLQLQYVVNGHVIKETLSASNAKYAVKSYSEQSGDFVIVVTAEKPISGEGLTQALIRGSVSKMENSERSGTITLSRVGTSRGRELIATTYCSGDAD